MACIGNSGFIDDVPINLDVVALIRGRVGYIELLHQGEGIFETNVRFSNNAADDNTMIIQLDNGTGDIVLTWTYAGHNNTIDIIFGPHSASSHLTLENALDGKMTISDLCKVFFNYYIHKINLPSEFVTKFIGFSYPE